MVRNASHLANRWWVAAIALLALFYLDGALVGDEAEPGAVHRQGSERAASAPSPLAPGALRDAEGVAQAGRSFQRADLLGLLARVNPSLGEGERERIADAVLRYASKYDLDAELVTAVLLVESSGRPWVESPKGAVGLMQVMPHMMEPMGFAGNVATIEANVEAGCWILASNIERLGEERGISAYFWGSDIRGMAYLEKVRAARDLLRSQRHS